MKFSKPFESYGHKKYDNSDYKGFYRRFNEEENFPEMAGKDIRAYFNFDTEKGEQIKMKFALFNCLPNISVTSPPAVVLFSFCENAATDDVSMTSRKNLNLVFI